MLSHLAVNDIVLIDRLGLDFEDGMTVLTGETGAGKSILLDALALALGSRGDAGLVRAGEKQGAVTAVFEPPPTHPAYDVAAEHEVDRGEALVLRRVQLSDGRSRAFLNDRPVGVGRLAEIGRTLVEIHGQHETRALVDPAEHRRLLDAYAGLAPDLDRIGAILAELRGLEARRDALKAELERASRDADFMHAAAEELATLAPEIGEEETLAARRQALMGAEKVAADLHDAHEVMGGSESPVPVLSSLLRRLERKADAVPGLLDETVAALGGALDQLDLARDALDAAIRSTEFDPRELERVEERLFALRAAGRKYQTPIDDIPALAAEFEAKLAALDLSSGELAGLDTRIATAAAAYDSAAAALSERRREAAGRLEEAVNRELPALRLEAARFSVRIDTDLSARGAEGRDRVGFEVMTNPGTRPGPILKVASGGELARFMLALKVALADKGSAPTLIFDEVDTGAGGAVAEAIGRRLARLAERVQVLAVTHAPQVAARADRHLVIAKRPAGDGTRVATSVGSVEGRARREEVARMLSGARITDEARAAADRLIAAHDE